MHPALTSLAICFAVPLACLGLVMWLAWLEDTLDESVARAVRRPAPEPILAIPLKPVVPAAGGWDLVAVPEPLEPAAAAVPEPAAAPAPEPAAEPAPGAVPEPVGRSVSEASAVSPFIPQQRGPEDLPIADPAVTPAT